MTNTPSEMLRSIRPCATDRYTPCTHNRAACCHRLPRHYTRTPQIATMATRKHRSLADLQAEIAALQHKASQARQREVSDVVDKIKKAIAAYGLTAADLGLRAGNSPAPKPPRATSTNEPQARRAPKGVEGSKIAPKYRDEAGNTWTGRGLKPRWLTAALQAGRKIEDFVI